MYYQNTQAVLRKKFKWFLQGHVIGLCLSQEQEKKFSWLLCQTAPLSEVITLDQEIFQICNCLKRPMGKANSKYGRPQSHQNTYHFKVFETYS